MKKKHPVFPVRFIYSDLYFQSWGRWRPDIPSTNWQFLNVEMKILFLSSSSGNEYFLKDTFALFL